MENSSTKAVQHCVVIPAFNGEDLLEDCVDSILKADRFCLIVIVDNASTDDTEATWSQDGRVSYLRNDKNFGFGYACNQGMNHAFEIGAKTITILNQDATISNNLLHELSSTLERNSNCSIACPMNYEADGLISREFAGWLVGTSPSLLTDAIANALHHDYPVGFLNAACWMFNVSLLKELGGFDPIFIMYQEDKELASRVHYYGQEIRINPQATIIHKRALRAQVSSLGEKLYWASTRPFSNLVGGTRNYERPFLRNLPGTLLNWLKGVIALTLALNWIGVAGYCAALAKFILTLGKNHQRFNRIRNREHGLFLELKNNG